jgi:DNA-binding NtrC family response regulator
MQRQKILIIEDDPAMVLYYTFALEAEFDILSATNGNSAIDQIKHLEDIDLVILDYKLQDMSGIDVLRKIKSIKPSVPIIIITAYGDEDVAVSSFRCGAKEYIKKPVSYDELFEKIRFCLSLRSADKNNRSTRFPDATYRAQPCYPRSVSTSHNFIKIRKAVQHIDNN